MSEENSKSKNIKNNKKEKEKNEDLKNEKEKEKEIKKSKKPVKTLIVNELPMKKPRILMPSKILKKPTPQLKILYIYRRELFELLINETYKIIDLKKEICEKLHLLERNFNIYFKEEIITEENYNEDVKKYLNNNKKGKNFFQIKKKRQNYEFISNFIQKTYGNKVKVEGIQNLKDFYSKIEFFFENSLFEKDFICEPIGEKNYLVGFCFADLAFDFHRYLLLLKATNKLYQNINATFHLKKSNLEQHIKYIKKSKVNKGTSFNLDLSPDRKEKEENNEYYENEDNDGNIDENNELVYNEKEEFDEDNNNEDNVNEENKENENVNNENEKEPES